MLRPESSNGKKFLLGPVATAYGAAKTGTWRVVRPVFDKTTCTACRLCENYCPAGVVSVDKREKANHLVTFDLDYCKGCGICMSSCARKSIQMLPERDFV